MESDYKERCERVAKAMGVEVSYTSTSESGFDYRVKERDNFEHFGVPNIVMERIENLLACRDGLRAVVKEALEPGVFGPWHTIEDRAFAYTDLHELCKRHGYGAVMHNVEYLWKTNGQHPGSEHTCAACASVRTAWIDDARAALKIGETKQ